MKILVLNCGSTNIKFKLFDRDTLDVLSSGLVDRMNLNDSNITIFDKEGNKQIIKIDVQDYQTGVRNILKLLKESESIELQSLNEIGAVGHRIAAGGVRFKESMVVTSEVMKGIKDTTPLAPLHNPANIEGILAIQTLLGNIKQVAVFDTAFHQTIPEHAYVYGLPYEMYKENGIRKYGFHGTSHRYVSQRACEFLGIDYSEQRMIVAHLGGGSSVCAILNGKSVDASLGMTTLGGVMMGTRCGDIDPGLIPLIMAEKNLTIDEISKILYKDSGLLGVSGVSKDMRDVENAANKGNHRAKLAMDIFAYQIKKQIGSFAAVLGGVDVLVFTGGIGENHAYTRQKVCEGMEYLSLELDPEKNGETHGEESVISNCNSKAKILVVPTDEELMIAKDTVSLLS